MHATVMAARQTTCICPFRVKAMNALSKHMGFMLRRERASWRIDVVWQDPEPIWFRNFADLEDFLIDVVAEMEA